MTPPDTFAMDRRTLLQHIGLLLGASAALGACASLPEAVAAAPASSFALSEAERATLAALADTILPATDTPGALAAGVPAQVEAMMARWAAPANRAEMQAGLARVAALGGGFAALSPAEREAALTPHDAAALVITRQAGNGLQALLTGGPQRQDQGYAILRELIVVLYYNSQIALTQELEWTAIPGRWDPSVPLTADSRSISNGISLF